MTNRVRGTGSIGKHPNSPYYQIRFYDASGRQRKESCKSSDRGVAEKLLQKRLGQVQLGVMPERQIRYEDIRRLLLNDYQLNYHKSLQRLKSNNKLTVWGLKWCDSYFKQMKVIHIQTETLTKFVIWRRTKHKVTDSTINRSLALVRRMLNLAKRERWIQVIPFVPMLPENEPRQGFLERPEFEQLRAALPQKFHALVTFLYTTGCRIGEAKSIVGLELNLVNRRVVLQASVTKNNKARTLPLTDELVSMLTPLKEREVAPVFDTQGFREAWEQAHKKLKWHRRVLVHDLRRSAVRNMMRAGVQQSVAMAISGHRTNYVFQNYNVSSEDDLHKAMAMVENRK